MCGVLFSSIQIDVYAHNFYQNKDSVFFTLVKRYEVELNLTSDSAQDNESITLKHSENAVQLLKGIDSINIDTSNNTKYVKPYDIAFGDQNSTTKALVTANLADDILREYGRAKGLDLNRASSLLNMSMNMNMGNMNMGPNMSSSGAAGEALISAKSQIVDQGNFETSLMLAKSLKSLFDKDLKNATIVKSTGLLQIPMEMKRDSVHNLGLGINNLALALTRMATLQEVFSIVHGQIHPNLFLAYDLKLKGE